MNRSEFLSLVLRNPVNAIIVDELFTLALPDFSAENYAKKAARWKTLWPEVTVLGVDGVK
jgi:hypothetical protein